MARIRTIKPEFPQSESIGALSRDARLLFVLLWTIVDDAGRTRAASRMLASLLYPYDDDAKHLIDGWLNELAAQRLVTLYEVDGSKYLEISNWLKHQKIDRPSASKLPEPNDNSTNTREDSRGLDADLVPSTLDLGRDYYAASAREDSETGSLVSEEAFAIADELAAICGNGTGPQTPPGWCGAGLRVQAWLNAGWPRQVMIDGAKAVMARRKGKPVENVAYLEKPLADAFARFKQPVPVGTVGGTGPPRAQTERERKQQTTREILDALSNYTETSERGRQEAVGVLPGHSGE